TKKENIVFQLHVDKWINTPKIKGVVEIWLTSEDLGAYGHDINVTLPQLLWKLVEVIPEGARMRLGMTNPPYILEHLEEMAKILNHPRVYKFLHVPVQSASDSVLMDMKREYSQADFRHVVDFLKQRVPEITIATDLICGFPTETEKDFEETMDLVDEYKFPSLFINQYFPRPGTPAAKMPRIPAQQVKKRTKAVSELFQSYTPYDHKLGEVQNVLVTEVSKDRQYYVGHNECYDQVLVPKDEHLLGKLVEVQITETGKHFLKCALTKNVFRPDVPLPLKQGQVSGVSQVQTSNQGGTDTSFSPAS
ncbi:threonylcarbamoyladenosine tRNA methylthiotransferase CDKAL1, partial [Mytilus galloprovincialis]